MLCFSAYPVKNDVNLAALLPKSGNTAELMEINEVSAAIREMADGEEGEETEIPMSNWLNITNAVFSPDGYGMLLLSCFEKGLEWVVL